MTAGSVPDTSHASGAGSIFETAWWLDAVAPGAWSEATVVRDGECVARLPYVLKRVGPVRIMANPPLVPVLGPWLRPIDGKEEHRLGQEIALLGELIDQLPAADVVVQSLSPRLTNWLPFYWRGYSGQLRYTYRIEDPSDLDRVWSGLRENIRREVRKASRTVEVRRSTDVEAFLEVFRPTLPRVGKPGRLEDMIRRAERASRERDASTILLAVDESDRVRAGTMLVRDQGAVYYLLAGRDHRDAPVGAPSLLVWEGIKDAAERRLAFDFEGSMVETIERFFRAFGARQTPYVRVLKSSVRGRAFEAVRRLLRRPAM